MKRIAALLSIVCLSGCASVYRGEGYVLSSQDARAGRYDESYYVQSDAELERFNTWFRNRHSAETYKHGKMDCDKWARMYEIEMILKYNAFSFGGDAPAVQTNLMLEKRHMNIIVETVTGIKFVEPQTGQIVE